MTLIRFTNTFLRNSLNVSVPLRRWFSYNENPSTLTDSFGRFHNYLRISLSEKCNLRCVYCMPLEGVQLSPKQELLSLEEFKDIVSLFAELGVTKLRFTGGEPTVSKYLAELIEFSRSIPTIQTVGITTNGILLNNQLDRLCDAGLTNVNISLDTLKPDRFGAISRRDDKLLYRVLASIFAAVAKGISVKVNCVVMRGVNLDELTDFLDLTKDVPVDIRFIEVMPFDHNNWSPTSLVSYLEMLDWVRSHGYSVQKLPAADPHDTTKWYSVDSFVHSPEEPSDADGNGTTVSTSTSMSTGESVRHRGRLGFITSMSSHFCNGCNRLRITADGKLKVCLFGDDEWSLRDALRRGTPREDLLRQLHDAITLKKRALGGHDSPEHLAASKNRPMILIGG